MCDIEGNVILVSIDEMLLKVYNNYKQIVDVVLKTNIAKLQKDIDELTMMAKIKAVLPKWLKQNPDEPDKVIAGVSQDTLISIEIVTALFEKYNINRILKLKTDIQHLEIEKQKIQANLNNLEMYVWDDKYQVLLT